MIQIEIAPQDFPMVLEQMTEADSEGCLNSMLEEIKRRETLLTDRMEEDAHENALDLMERTARQETKKYYGVWKKKDTKLRWEKLSNATALEEGIERIVEKLRIKYYDSYRNFKRIRFL